MPMLQDVDLDQDMREAAFLALRGYYETERGGDPRIRSLISESLMRARDAAGTERVLAPLGSLYFSEPWIGHDRMERIYGPFGRPQFLMKLLLLMQMSVVQLATSTSGSALARTRVSTNDERINGLLIL